MNKIFKFLKGFLYINGILGGFMFWLLFSCYLIISWSTDNSMDLVDVYWIIKAIAGILFMLGFPLGISFGMYCAKEK